MVLNDSLVLVLGLELKSYKAKKLVQSQSLAVKPKPHKTNKQIILYFPQILSTQQYK